MSDKRKSNERVKELRTVAEIKKRFGSKIDLDKTPLVIIEIIRSFRDFEDTSGTPIGVSAGVMGGPISTGTGGVGPGVSSILVVGADDSQEISNNDLMSEILKIRKSLNDLQKRIK